MAGRKIIEVNYAMPFEGMLVQAGVPTHQRNKIFDQLGTNGIEFKYRTKRSFEIENVRFAEPMISRTASRIICATATEEEKWKPLDIEHMLAYFIKSPKRFPHGLVYAAKRTFNVDGSHYIFVMSLERGRADLELVKDDHPWSHITSTFPKCRHIQVAD